MNEIVIIGTIAADTAVNIIKDNKEELRKTLSERFIKESLDKLTTINENNRDFINGLECDFCLEITEFGINGSLWDYAVDRKCGIEVELMDIPIEQETIEICEVFDVNPYVSYSKNVFIVSVKSSYEVLKKSRQAGIIAAAVGIETDSKDRVIVNKDEKKYLTPTNRADYFSERYKHE